MEGYAFKQKGALLTMVSVNDRLKIVCTARVPEVGMRGGYLRYSSMSTKHGCNRGTIISKDPKEQ